MNTLSINKITCQLRQDTIQLVSMRPTSQAFVSFAAELLMICPLLPAMTILSAMANRGEDQRNSTAGT